MKDNRFVIKVADCMCHPETCCHWVYQVFDTKTNKRRGGSDYKDQAEKLRDGLELEYLQVDIDKVHELSDEDESSVYQVGYN